MLGFAALIQTKDNTTGCVINEYLKEFRYSQDYLGD